ncbi:MAG: hypothetical protein HYY87_02830 [Candidatus Levybacteria bacterium]|nr:hypothetical protein [Candidatus Levybacteria bacterium]MBI2622757.1 hypothetical protein [Candidatus Levybacteria bacterium]MBI3070216.1 hypothetical protein [Candidatus Levybacteria bacterium]MBI3093029.1 hypothetical protein [Candidatus Levybacteria bacterium]
MEEKTLQKLKELIASNEKIAIAVGKNSGIDEMGAALALYLSLQSSSKDVVIACPTEPLVEVSSLVGIDKVRTALATDGADLVVSFPYKEGEIEKVSYTLEDGYLNIIVKAGNAGLSFSEKEISYKRGGGNFAGLLFVIGTARLSDLGNLFNPEMLKDATVVNIDNKVDNQGFGDLVLGSPRFSSVCEQVANLINSLGLPLDIDSAQNLLSGLSFATDNFQKPTTSFLAFEMAGLLIKKGAVRKASPKYEDTALQDFSFTPPKIRQPADKTKPLPQVQSQIQEEDFGQDRQDQEEPPSDWLAPKVYKGSTLV